MPSPNPAPDSVTVTPEPARLRPALRGLVKQPLYWLLVAIPVAAVLHGLHSNEVAVFLVSCLAIIPLAGLMGRATESLAETLGSGVGGLLNATFGNAAELILALMALAKGPQMYPLVKASITGSIIGNILLVLGLSILLGGLRYPRQTFNRTAASLGATLLALAAIGLVMPALYFYVLQHGAALGRPEQLRLESLSEEIAAVLIGIYLLSLVFSLKTHRHLFSGEEPLAPVPHTAPEWSRATAMVLLLTATLGVAWMSELLVSSVEHAGAAMGMTPVFVGVIVVAMVGNAAEHSTAVMMALRNKMDLAFHVAVGSGIQIALFVAPVLVFASLVMGHGQAMDLHFTILETIAVLLAVGALALVCQDGECHWMEGVMLLGVYVIFALAFYHLPEAAG